MPPDSPKGNDVDGEPEEIWSNAPVSNGSESPQTPTCEGLSETNNGQHEAGQSTEYRTPPPTVLPELIPYIGKEFQTDNEAYTFYNIYASIMGFSIRKSSTHRNNKGQLIDRVYCCSYQGSRPSDKRDILVKKQRPVTRCGCLALMKISSRHTGTYRVVKFVPEHIHEMAAPKKNQLLRSQRSCTDAHAIEIDRADRSGIKPKSSMELMSNMGGWELVGITLTDYNNCLRSKRTLQIGVDETGGILGYLKQMQVEDPNFYYGIQVDECALITNIFWADRRMKMDYKHFGDVVCFDTSYRKNLENRPVVLFVGVNHHKQSIIFGAALLYNETADTFMWLFDTFKEAMDGKTPMTMLTDQDAAIARALSTRWPETKHRLCIWHIYQNAVKHLSHVFEKHKGFAHDFTECVYGHEHEDEFLHAWASMLRKYNVGGQVWLKRLFDQREKWAMVYGRDAFCADMMTTQRSESINSQMKRFVSYNFNIIHFFDHFKRMLDDCRYKELKADFLASRSQPVMAFQSPMLKHGASVYTPAVFQMFQQELGKLLLWNIDRIKEDETRTTYRVYQNDNQHEHVVEFGIVDNAVDCSCKRFQFVGILCSHAFAVLNHNNVKKIPTQYIKKRWTKDAKLMELGDMQPSNTPIDPKAKLSKRYREIYSISNRIGARAVEKPEIYRFALIGLLQLLEGVESLFKNMEAEAAMGETSQNFESRGDQPIPPSCQQSQATNEESIPTMQDMSSNGSDTVQGFKSRPSSERTRTSKRPLNAIEKATGKKKITKESGQSGKKQAEVMTEQETPKTDFSHDPQPSPSQSNVIPPMGPTQSTPVQSITPPPYWSTHTPQVMTQSPTIAIREPWMYHHPTAMPPINAQSGFQPPTPFMVQTTIPPPNTQPPCFIPPLNTASFGSANQKKVHYGTEATSQQPSANAERETK